MGNKLSVLMLSVGLVMGLSLAVCAQSDIDTEFISGVVSEISSSKIVVNDSDEERSLSLEINADTVFENIQSSDQISVGDEVFVDYQTENEANMAVNIYKIGVLEENYDQESYDEKIYLEEASEEVEVFVELYNESEEDK